MHKFIFDKKVKNNMKYKHESKLNNIAIPVPKGTVSIMLNTEKKNPNYLLGQKLSNLSRFKMKWKTIQWLMINKGDCIEYMMKEKINIWDKYCNIWEDHRLKKKEFEELLVSIGMGTDKNMSDKLFL